MTITHRLALILISTVLAQALALPVFAQTTVNLTNGQTNSTAYDTTGNALTFDLASGAATQSGVISGTGSLTKTGAGTLTLPSTNINTYTGGTTISGGTLALAIPGSEDALVTALGTGPILVTNGGTLTRGNNTLNFDQAITVAGAGSLLSTTGGSNFLSIGFNGTGSLTVTQGGAVTIANNDLKIASNYRTSGEIGQVSLSGSGTSLTVGFNINIANDSNGTGSLTASDNATLTANSGILIGSNGTLTLDTGAVATTGGSNGLANYGTVNLNAGGTLRVGSSLFSTGTVNFAGGTLQAHGTDFSTENLGTLAGGATNTLDTNGLNIAWNGVVSGAGNLTKTGSGTLTLAGANTYTGDTLISAGTLRFATADATLSYGGAISGAGNLAKAGSSRLTLTGDNTYAGTTAVDAGTLVFADRGSYYGGTLDATTAGKLTTANGATAGFGVGGSGYFSESDLGIVLTHATFTSGARLGLDTTAATAGTFTLAGVLTDTASGANSLGLDKLGAGNLTLNSANTYTGGTVVHAGTLTLGHASALGSTSAALTLNGGTLDLGTYSPTVGTATFNGGTFTHGTLDNAAAFVVQTGTLPANLGGTAALTKTGTGAFTLSGDNTYTGTTTVSAGTLTFADRGAYYGGTVDATTAARLSVASGATAAFGVGATGYFSTTDLGTLLASGSFAGGSSLGVDTTAAPGGTFTWAAPALGALGLNKTGSGTLLLPGTSTYTGPTLVTAGTLQIGDGGATGFAGSGITNSGTVVFNHSNDLTSATAISGPGSFTKTGEGKLTLSSFTSTGGFTVSGGELAFTGGAGAINNQAVVVTGSGSVLRYNTFSRTVGLSGSGSLSISDGASVINPSTFFSSFLVVGSSSSDASGTVTVHGSGSTLTWGGRLIVGNQGTGTLNVAAGATATFAQANESTLALNGTGTLNLSGTDSALTLGGRLIVADNGTGTVNIGTGATFTANRLLLAQQSGSTGTLNLSTGGTLVVSDATATAISSGAGTATFNWAGGTLKSNGTNALTVTSHATLASGTTSTFDTNGQAGTFAGVLSGSGSLTKAGAGALTLSAANTYTGDTTISAGTLTLGHSSALGSSTLTTATGLDFGALTAATFGGLSGNQDLALTNASAAAVALTVGANAASTTYSGILSGSGSLIKTGAGTLTLSGANTYSGGTTVSAGTLAGSTASLSGNITNDATVTFDQASAGTYAGVISGTGALTKTGAGNLTLSGANSYAGNTTVSAGTLTLGAGGETGSVTGNIANHGTIVFNRSGDQTYSGVISGSGNVIHEGVIMRLSSAQTYTGATTINRGIVVLPAVNQGLASTTPVTIAAGATLDISNHATTVAGLTGAGSVYSFGGSSGHLTVETASGQNQTFTGVLGSSYADFALTKSGPGTLTLSGPNTYTGATTLEQGTLTAGSATAFGTGTVRVNAGTLDLGGQAISNTLDVRGGTLTGLANYAGTQTLSAATTYTGTVGGAVVVASGGSLNTTGATFTGATTIQSGGLLKGTGTLAAVTVASGGIIAPGNSPGTITFTQGLTLNTGSILNFELGSSSDLIVVNGGTLTGPSGTGGVTLNFSNSGGFAAGTYTLINYTSATLSDFSASDFSIGSSISGYTYSLALSGNALQLTATASAIPEPSTYAALLGAAALSLAVYRKRRAV